MKGEIGQAQEALTSYQSAVGVVERTKKTYMQSVGDMVKLRVKLDKARSEGATVPKFKQKALEVHDRCGYVMW